MDTLFVIQGNDQGRRFALKDPVITIGRDSSNTIRLRDPEASRRHAEIVRKESGRTIRDLESSNGLFINGSQAQSRRLVNGDQIQIGKTVLLYASRAVDIGAQEPLVDVFQEADSTVGSRVLHSLAPEEGRRLFERATENEVKAAWLEKARAHLNFMYHATLAASRTLDVERLLDKILELIFQWAPVDRGCIFLYDADANKLVPKSSRTRKKGGRVKVSQTILNYAFKNQKGVLTSNARSDERWDGSASVLQTGVKEAICAPMQGRYGLVGVIYIDVSRRADEFSGGKALGPESSSLGFPPLSNKEINDVSSSLRSEAKIAEQEPFSNGQSGSSNEELEYDSPTLENKFEIPSDAGTDARSTFLERSDFNESSLFQAWSTETSKLTLDHLKLMVAIGRQAALAVEDTQYYLGLAQAERLAAIGQTVAILSHHIKNILQGIRGGSFLIHTGLKEHDETLVVKGWNIVEKNQTKISDLVLDMLTFSKERVPVWTFASFNDVISDAIELMRGRANDLEIDLEYYPDPSIPAFYFDKEQIHRAIVNLIGNALEASKNYVPEQSDKNKTATESPGKPRRFPRGRVEVTLKYDAESKRVFVIVDDVGPGVPVESRETIFRPFASKNKSGGTGLGLAVTNKIVQEHKGKITIDDSPLGGARFSVDLPLVLEKPIDDEEEDSL